MFSQVILFYIVFKHRIIKLGGNTTLEEDASRTEPPDPVHPTILNFTTLGLETNQDTTTFERMIFEAATTSTSASITKKTDKMRECFTFEGDSCIFPFRYAGVWHHK